MLMCLYHFIMSLIWRLILIILYVPAFFGLELTALYTVFNILYHDEMATKYWDGQA